MKDENINDYINEVQMIGLRIAYFRKLNGMTQRELADQLGINKNYLSHIESGSTDKVVSLPLLIRISKALNIELALLVDIEDMKSAKNGVLRQMEEVRAMFDEVKRFSSELDRMMLEMNNFDPNRLKQEQKKPADCSTD